MQQDYFSYLFGAINDLLGSNSALFESMGMALFRALAVLMLCWFGVQSTLSGSGGAGGFHWQKFAALVQEILLCYVMLAFYTVPIPGLGVSFTHLILDQVQSMTATLNLTSVQNITDTLNNVETNLPYPSVLDILEIIRFMILLFAVVAAQAATLFVIMFGYVATAVIVLLGPVFIPFKILPQMEWMFWGWFRSFVQFSFYQLVAAAYVFVFGEFLQKILAAKATNLSGADVAYLFVPLLLTLVTFVLGIIKIPALTFSIFSGRAGDYVFLWWR